MQSAAPQDGAGGLKHMTANALRVKMHDKHGPLVSIGKHLGMFVEKAVRQGRLMSDVYWGWRSVPRGVRSALDLATRGLRGRSPHRLGLNLSVDHDDLPRRTATS